MGEPLEDYVSHGKFPVSGELDLYDRGFLYAFGQCGYREDSEYHDEEYELRLCLSHVMGVLFDCDRHRGSHFADYLKEGLLL